MMAMTPLEPCCCHVHPVITVGLIIGWAVAGFLCGALVSAWYVDWRFVISVVCVAAV